MHELTPDLSTAIVVWSGWGETAWPARDRARLVEAFGEHRADVLISRIAEIESEFYASRARFAANDLKEMADLAITDFRRRDAGLSDQAVEALAWCYTYDHK